MGGYYYSVLNQAGRQAVIRQLLVILGKEWEELKYSFFSVHPFMAGVWPIILFCIAFSVYEPLRFGPEWLQSPMMIFSISVLIPFTAIGFISPYSFVGERMRGTLEPLLATPVSDQAILFGKIGLAVLYGWGITLVNMLLGMVVINIFLPDGGILFYPPGIVVPTILLSLLFSILVATIGTSSSFYAKTILDAQRNLVMIVCVPVLLPAFFLGPFMPGAWKDLLVQMFTHPGAIHILFVLILTLIIVDGIFIILALTRFKRKKLLLI
jgi:ABC-2 type transport system permease protein